MGLMEERPYIMAKSPAFIQKKSCLTGIKEVKKKKRYKVLTQKWVMYRILPEGMAFVQLGYLAKRNTEGESRG